MAASFSFFTHLAGRNIAWKSGITGAPPSSIYRQMRPDLQEVEGVVRQFQFQSL